MRFEKMGVINEMKPLTIKECDSLLLEIMEFIVDKQTNDKKRTRWQQAIAVARANSNWVAYMGYWREVKKYKRRSWAKKYKRGGE